MVRYDVVRFLLAVFIFYLVAEALVEFEAKNSLSCFATYLYFPFCLFSLE